MASISSIIESYLKKLLEDSEKDFIEIQRNELAQKFSCVPSQINYVLSTRFNLESGYIVESQRGGGGYVRIRKIPINRELSLINEICNLVGDAISQQSAYGIIQRLYNENLLSKREADIIAAALSRDVLRLGLPARDQLRANILKNVLITVLQSSNL
ncbi:MAG: CtsR family transcriptional regulator [Clostridiales bacterium]|nr:CtsR family transcriptional regulator [Clostridiales bacterium]MCF8023848.1 CtsR family transcriptional regulator [Clostridiales bacterium]